MCSPLGNNRWVLLIEITNKNRWWTIMKCNNNKTCQQEVIRMHSSPKNLLLHVLIKLQLIYFNQFYISIYLEQIDFFRVYDKILWFYIQSFDLMIFQQKNNIWSDIIRVIFELPLFTFLLGNFFMSTKVTAELLTINFLSLMYYILKRITFISLYLCSLVHIVRIM